MTLFSKTSNIKPNTVLVNIISAFVLAVASITPANAASQCKGLSNNECGANAMCSWVEGYERKDGRTVKSFCRTKSGGTIKVTTQQPADKGVRKTG